MNNIIVLVKNNLRILFIKKPMYSILMVLCPLIISFIMFKLMDDTSGIISSNLSQMLIGFMIMFALYRAMSGTALINEDKEENIYTRILAASIKTWEYYLSNIISVIVLLIILFGLSILGINIFTDIDFGVSKIALFIILCLISIVSVSIGTFCNSVTDDRDLSDIISTVLIVVFLFVGGCFVPIQDLPKTINIVSYFTPTRWAMEAINNIQNGESINVIIMNLGMLLLFAALFFITAVYCINRRDKTDYVN